MSRDSFVKELQQLATKGDEESEERTIAIIYPFDVVVKGRRAVEYIEIKQTPLGKKNIYLHRPGNTLPALQCMDSLTYEDINKVQKRCIQQGIKGLIRAAVFIDEKGMISIRGKEPLYKDGYYIGPIMDDVINQYEQDNFGGLYILPDERGQYKIPNIELDADLCL